MNNEKQTAKATEEEEKVNAIQFIPDAMSEYDEIKAAADKTKRSLASFCFFHSLEAARAINAKNA